MPAVNMFHNYFPNVKNQPIKYFIKKLWFCKYNLIIGGHFSQKWNFTKKKKTNDLRTDSIQPKEIHLLA